MASFLSPLLRQRFFDSNGLPLAGGKLYSYAATTTTPQDTYTNSSGTLNTNPVTLDSQGYADVWIDPTLSYKFILKDSGGSTQWTVDNVSSPFEVTAWSSTISYSQGQIVQDSSGYGLFYVSLTNNNVNNALSSVSNWRRLGGNIRTVSTNTTLLITDELVRSNSTSGNLTHTLPAIATTPIGTKITIKDVGTGGNTTSVKGNAAELIDGSNTWSLALSQYASVEFENNGTTWDTSWTTPDGSITTSKLGSKAVTAAKIADATITATQIANTTITAGKIVNGTLTGTQISTNDNLPGSAFTAGGRRVVVSNSAPSTYGLSIIRGAVQNDATILGGEGFTAVHTSTGVYTLTWSTALLDVPAIVVTINNSVTYKWNVTITSTTGAVVNTFGAGDVAADASFSFIAIAQRNT